MYSFIEALDQTLLLFIKNNLHVHILDKLMVFITDLGNYGVIWIVISLVLIIGKKHWKIGVAVLIALGISSLLGDGILKFIVQRARPCALMPASELLIDKPLSYSFPSGHSMSSFACAIVLAIQFREKRWIGAISMLTAAFIAFSRLYLYVHYPSDVVAGMIFGIAVGVAVVKLFPKIGRYVH